MDTTQLIIWSAMFGGLATLSMFTLVDAVFRQRIASWRALAFVLLAGAACFNLTGLPEFLFPELAPHIAPALKNSLSLFCGALGLKYLGHWVGVAYEDQKVRSTIRWGVRSLMGFGTAMAVASLLASGGYETQMLTITAVINVLALGFAASATLRAAQMGDRLAWGMAGTTVLLLLVILGLFGHALKWYAWENGVRALTATITVAFFTAATYLGLRRDRLYRQLERLAAQSLSDDPVTGLPRGSVLLSKVEDAIWRSARKSQLCTVICLHLRNLYQLADLAGHAADLQILPAMTARMRRAVGFRCVVGLYHPRCFVIVLMTEPGTQFAERTMQRLRFLMSKPLTVNSLDHQKHVFTPQFGIGAVTVMDGESDAAAAIDEAERIARAIETDCAPTTSADIELP